MFAKAQPYLELSQASMMELFGKNSKQLSDIFAKSFIIYNRLCFKYTSEKTETFNIKLTLAKSSRLLQRVANFVFFFKSVFYFLMVTHFTARAPNLKPF